MGLNAFAPSGQYFLIGNASGRCPELVLRHLWCKIERNKSPKDLQHKHRASPCDIEQISTSCPEKALAN